MAEANSHEDMQGDAWQLGDLAEAEWHTRKQGVTLRTEVEALRKLVTADNPSWMGLDKEQRGNLAQLIDIALRAPDTASK